MKTGWFNESRRHSLASKGIKSAQKVPRMPKLTKAERQKKLDENTLKNIEAVFKDVEKGIIQDLKEPSNERQIPLTHGMMPQFRDFFGSELDEDYMWNISDDAREQVNYLFEEMEERLSEKGIAIIGDEGDGSVIWAMNEKGSDRYQKEMGFE